MEESINYSKIQNDWKKLLIKNSKKFQPWDYSFFMDNLNIMLHSMQDYYNYGKICQSEETLTKVKMSLNQVVFLCDKIQNHNYKNFSLNNNITVLEKNNVLKITWENEETRKVFYDDIMKAEKEKQEDIEQLFKLIGDNVQYWWD